MDYVDLREWLKAVESHNELKHISGAHWDLEMSGIAELAYGTSRGPKPALMFENIPGYPKDYRTLFGLLASPWRIASTLGLPEDQLDNMSLLINWREKHKSSTPIPPELVTKGRVLENTDEGGKIDLFKFPVPRFHELDTQRYIGTCDAVIQKDPDTGYVNVGTYRNMVVDHNHFCLHWGPSKHGNLIMQKYFSQGKPMPVAVAIGVDPALWFCAGIDLPWQVSEYDFAGGLKKTPIQVINAPQTGLPVPAHAEIVIEGECYEGELAEEGPFGEWHGYYANRGLSTVPEPVVRVKAVHYRNEPILTCSQPSIPPHEYSLISALSFAEEIWDRLENFGIPGIKKVWGHEVGIGLLFNVISVEQMYSGHSLQVGLIASQVPHDCGKYTVVVEEDIDPSNLEQVIWAIVTRASPERSIHIINHARSSNVDPTIPLSVKQKSKNLTGSRVIIDACRDMDWKKDWYPMARMSPQLKANLMEKWQELLTGLMGKGSGGKAP